MGLYGYMVLMLVGGARAYSGPSPRYFANDCMSRLGGFYVMGHWGLCYFSAVRLTLFHRHCKTWEYRCVLHVITRILNWPGQLQHDYLVFNCWPSADHWSSSTRLRLNQECLLVVYIYSFFLVDQSTHEFVTDLVFPIDINRHQQRSYVISRYITVDYCK